MNPSAIDSLSKDDYKRAFLAIKPLADHHREILRRHFSAPDYTVTATELADAMNYANYNAINLHYGKFAELICDELNVQPPVKLHVLLTDYKPDDDQHGHCQLVLRPALIEALTELRWFGIRKP